MVAVQVIQARSTSSLPLQALPEHMSLSIPDDIDAQVLDRSPQARTPQLCLALTRAADCLEEMGESLAHAGPPPQDSLATYQALLDWIHQFDASAGAAVEDPPELPDTPINTGGEVSREPLPTSSGGQAAPREFAQPDAAGPSTPPETAAATLRLAATQVDALLNLAVEDSIHSSRLRDRVARLELDLQLQRSGSRQWRLLAAELEQLVDMRGLGMPGSPRGNLDALEMDQYGELHILSRRIVEAAQDSQTFVAGFERELGHLRELLNGSERIQSELRRMVEHTRMVEVASVSPRLQRTVRQAARILGKSVQLQIRGEASLIDGQLLNTLLDPLMHLLRNAVDHGIEAAPRRLQSGKPEQGTITLEFRVDGARLDILCADDGAGLSAPDLRAAATAHGLLAEGADLSDALAGQLILLPGFSTRQQATLISGRGIGMDVVARTIDSLRGTLTLDSVPGHGLRVSLSLPTRMSMAKVMVSRSSSHVLAISERNIQELLPVSDALRSRADGQLQFMLRDTPIAAWRLEQLLQLPPMALRLAGRSEAVLIVQDERRERQAILVPEIGESRQVFVKTVGNLTGTSTGVDGVTILGDGAIASVIDLPDLLRAHLAGGRAEQLAPVPVARPRLCLVVDDSVSVRNSTTQLLQDTGYEVLCARDGMEALDILQNCTPDIVLADLEMPRMNGLELTRALRGREQTRLTPVLMITSRFTARHQALARSAGVNAFQAKPFAEDELLQVMGELLVQPGAPGEPDSIMPAWTNDSNPASP
jgi:chemosensory pili system protein ChpA (sensor histidine kinase/response regulator)